MKIGLYSKENRNILQGFADGILASGLSPVWQNPSVFTPDQTEEFDFIAIWGGAGVKSREVINAYAKFNIQSLVFEGGYVGSNTFSISINKHYWLPDFECPSDRMQKFNIKLTKEQKKDGYVLVLGQSAEINSMLAEKVRQLKTDRKIVFRPHPNVDFKIDGIVNIDSSFDEALKGAYCVMCHTSNSANYAIMKGIPVICSIENMVHRAGNMNCHNPTDVESLFFPDDKELTDYFSKLCYAVWTEEEIKNGTALEFYAAIITGENPIKKGDTCSVQDLKGKFKNQTAYIVGKGPSVKHLSKEDFPKSGLVIPLNETIKIVEDIGLDSEFTIISQQKDGKPECMVKPEKAPLLLHEHESKGWFDNHHKRYIFDIEKDYGLKVNDISVLKGKFLNCCSVIAAIEFAKYTGCKKIVFLCFDSYTDDIDDYPEDKRLGELYSVPERFRHLKDQKEQIPLHIKGLKTEFIKPEKKTLPFTVITLTGDRPGAFRLCKEYMKRQTVQPSQWIVVDDGKRALPKKDRSGVEYYRRKRLKDDPKHTLRVNMLKALKHVKNDRIVVVEDDDWYREDYLELSLKYLEKSDLVGQNTFFYWNVIEKSFHKVNKTNRPAMCLTAFKSPVLDLVKAICKNKPKVIESENERKKIDNGSVDLSLWSRWQGTKQAYFEGLNVCVGIKGVAGRKGHTLGHAKAHTDYFEPDLDGKMLEELIGSDVKNYIEV